MRSKHDTHQKFTVAHSDIHIPLPEQEAYIRYYETINLEQSSETEILHPSKRLLASGISLDDKRELLFRLAHIGTIRSFDLICDYLKHPNSKLQAWAILCLEECRMLLEMDLQLGMKMHCGDLRSPTPRSWMAAGG